MMPLDQTDLARIRELIKADRAEHSLEIAQKFSDSDARIADIGSELTLLSQRMDKDLSTVNQTTAMLFEFVKTDIKGPLDGLVADQTFVRNARRALMWGVGVIGSAWVAVQQAGPYITQFFSDKP